jgi:hypothetical protein
VLHQLPEIFTAALPPTATQHSPPASQAVSQFRNTIYPFPVPLFSSPGMANPQQAHLYPLATPAQSPTITRYATPRVRPIQAPSPRVNPRAIPRHIAPPRVDPIVDINYHPSPPNAPYVPQAIVGVNLFNTFEEEHM